MLYSCNTECEVYDFLLGFAFLVCFLQNQNPTEFCVGFDFSFVVVVTLAQAILIQHRMRSL
jgi:hypothetical protein